MLLLPNGLFKRCLLAMAVLLAASMAWSETVKMDRFFWPRSAHVRIETMAAIIRRIRSPARWCQVSDNPENIYEFDPKQRDRDLGRCLSAIAPASEFLETMPDYYVKRFYRAEVRDKFCEVTLSTVFDDDRVIGSDCYFGFFPKAKDAGIGMTDDKFG